MIKEMRQAALAKCDGNVSLLAREIGVDYFRLRNVVCHSNPRPPEDILEALMRYTGYRLVAPTVASQQAAA
ncbi:hypothetical protein [Aquamicrobium soli]|uniref:XRE family transcriptional regulator n=1 Tax=Aquamicrobium soli TaxID=1811518 RepID=A0ABV7K4X0_9HYPH